MESKNNNIKTKILSRLSWTDENSKNKFLKKVWCSFSLLQFPVTVLSLSFCIYLLNRNTELADGRRDRILIHYIGDDIGREDYQPGSMITNSYILGTSKKIVNLQENWSYETVEENYNELFRHHSSFEFENFLKANLLTSKMIPKIKTHKMVSSFRWDEKRSKAAWCAKLNAACAVITGTRWVFENGNRPITRRKVGYLIISNAVYPTAERPSALRVNRMIIEDNVEDPYYKLEPLFEAAKNGKLPEKKEQI